MLLDKIKPSPELADFINCYRIADWKFPPGKEIIPSPFPPRPQECLQFFPRIPEQVSFDNEHYFHPKSRCVINGQTTSMVRRHVSRDFLTILIVFKPGVLYSLTCIPASMLINYYGDAEDILGKEVILINEQLYHAESYTGMVNIVEKYLLTLINKKKRKHHIVTDIAKLMICTNDKLSIDYYMKESCICWRQFDRKFKEYIGVNPKLYERIIRIEKAFRLKNKHPHKDWLSIAVHCDYYDYRHLAKEYKDLTGLTPNELFSIYSIGGGHFLGEVET
jgi:AraC-like DNA-binding protein